MSNTLLNDRVLKLKDFVVIKLVKDNLYLDFDKCFVASDNKMRKILPNNEQIIIK